MATLILPDGTEHEVRPFGMPDFAATEIRSLIGGDFEVIATKPVSMSILLVREDSSKLSVNARASNLAKKIIRGTVLYLTERNARTRSGQ